MPFNPKNVRTASDQAIALATTHNFGKLSIDTVHKKFVDNKPIEIDEAEYNQIAEENGGRGVIQELVFTVDSTPFNPEAMYLYQRRVSIAGKVKVTDEHGKVKRVPGDWLATTLPSIEAVFGSIEGLGEAINAKGGVWVEVVDVPQVTDPSYGVTKFVQVFKDQSACAAAWKKMYGGKKVPENVKATARTLREAVSTKEEFMALVAGDDTLKTYNPEQLWALTEQ